VRSALSTLLLQCHLILNCLVRFVSNVQGEAEPIQPTLKEAKVRLSSFLYVAVVPFRPDFGTTPHTARDPTLPRCLVCTYPPTGPHKVCKRFCEHTEFDSPPACSFRPPGGTHETRRGPTPSLPFRVQRSNLLFSRATIIPGYPMQPSQEETALDAATQRNHMDIALILLFEGAVVGKRVPTHLPLQTCARPIGCRVCIVCTVLHCVYLRN
jgi:hypothetical protein